VIEINQSKRIVVTTIRDFTPFLEIENQKNLIKLRTTAFGSASHELKNPLNAINSSLEQLDHRIVAPEDRSLFETALNCTKLMMYLVKDFLDFSQIEA
jgi:signal transduction histidine kinase